MNIHRGAVIVCTNCPETKVFHIETGFLQIRKALKGWNWILDSYDNQFCSEACQIAYQKDCEHDEHYKIKDDLSTVCQNCGKHFKGVIYEND